jgi:hypothetical protein
MNYRIAGLICFIAFGLQVYVLNEFASEFGLVVTERIIVLSCILIPLFIYGYGKMIQLFRRKEFPSRINAFVYLGLTSLMGIFIILVQSSIWAELLDPQMR